ncbi:hypothetical protein GQ600_893 [Phytophthora cactorum]|nr:hypothetical protein GQ600_893 [Phytophthora cactorum]
MTATAGAWRRSQLSCLVTAAVKRSWMHTDDQCTPITSREHHCEGVFGDEFPDEAQRDLEKLRLLAPLRAPLRRLHTTRDALPELSEKLVELGAVSTAVSSSALGWQVLDGSKSPLEFYLSANPFEENLITSSMVQVGCIALAKTTVSSGTV